MNTLRLLGKINFKPVEILPPTFGIFIGLINTLNIKKSPIYDPDLQKNNVQILKFTAMISLKSFIYCTTFPIATLGIAHDLLFVEPEHFESHFIPFSRYGREKNKITTENL